MELFALLIFGSFGLGALFSGSSDDDDTPPENVVLPEECTVQNGTDGDDILNGLAGDDTIQGGAGDDTLNGDEDSDAIYGGEGNDQLDGGAGDDYLQGDDGDDLVYGGAGEDWLISGNGSDELHGGDGDDLLTADLVLEGEPPFNGEDTAETDTLYGGEGNDRLSSGYTYNGSGYSYDSDGLTYDGGGYDPNVGNLYGEAGDDVLSGVGLLDGGEGNDTLQAVATVGAESVTVLTGGAGVDTFVVGHGFDPDDHGTDEAPYLGLYDPVTITDFGSSSTLVINVPSGYGSGFSTYGGGEGGDPYTLDIVIDGPDGNEYVVAIIEGYRGVFNPEQVTFQTF